MVESGQGVGMMRCLKEAVDIDTNQAKSKPGVKVAVKG